MGDDKNLDINWSNLILTLLGSLTGGLVTWRVTKKSLKKQFNFEMEMKQRQFNFEMKMNKISSLRKILKALIAIKREMNHNILESDSLLILMEKNNWKRWNFEKDDQYINLRNIKWIEFNHELINNELKEKVDDIENFYHNISLEISNQATNKERIEYFIENGKQCINILDENIKFIKDKIEEMDN